MFKIFQISSLSIHSLNVKIYIIIILSTIQFVHSIGKSVRENSIHHVTFGYNIQYIIILISIQYSELNIFY